VLPDDDEARFGKAGKRLCADIDGWNRSGRSPACWTKSREVQEHARSLLRARALNLHAAVTVHADDDEGRENLCRYILRHPISLQRLSMTA